MNVLRARLQQIYQQLNQSTGGLPGIIHQTVVSFGQDDGPALAAAIAYRALFSFFPLALLLLAFSSSFLVSVTEAHVVSFVESFLPTAGNLVRNNVATVQRTRGAVGALAALGLVWSASSVFAVIDRAVNRAWGATIPRSFWRRQALALAIVLGVGLLFILSTLTPTFYSLLTRIELPVLGIHPFNGALIGWLTFLGPMLLDYAVFLMLYRLLPVVPVRWQEALPGALAASSAWQLAKFGFNLYVKNFARYNLVYGSLTAIVVFLTFTYIAAVILVMGAEFTAAWTQVRRQKKESAMWNEKDLAGWIAEHQVDAEVVCLAVATPTVETAAAAVNAPPQAILKSLVFMADGQPYLVMANGLHHIDRARLAAHWGLSKKRVKMAAPDQVLELTGYPVGAVPPFGHRCPLPALLDPAVLEQPVIYAGGGGLQALLRLTPQELLRVAGPQVVRVTAGDGGQEKA